MDGDVWRSDDVLSNETERARFSDFPIRGELLRCMVDLNILRPSPIQLKSFPPGLAGKSLLIQAKSGTGKTLVFAVIALNRINTNTPNITEIRSKTNKHRNAKRKTKLRKAASDLHAIVVAPTREIALQIADEITRLSWHISPRINCVCSVGGIPHNQEITRLLRIQCHVLVATPGRLGFILRSGYRVNRSQFRFFALDEADRLLDYQFRSRVSGLITTLVTRQVQFVAASATFSPSQVEYIEDILYENDKANNIYKKLIPPVIGCDVVPTNTQCFPTERLVNSKTVQKQLKTSDIDIIDNSITTVKQEEDDICKGVNDDTLECDYVTPSGSDVDEMDISDTCSCDIASIADDSESIQLTIKEVIEEPPKAEDNVIGGDNNMMSKSDTESESEDDTSHQYNGIRDIVRVFLCSSFHMARHNITTSSNMDTDGGVLEVAALKGLRFFVHLKRDPIDYDDSSNLLLEASLEVLYRVPFRQCLIFCNNNELGAKLVSILSGMGIISVYTSGRESQAQRVASLRAVKSFQSRILVCSDVIARGVDLQAVDLVINLDLPLDRDTFLHRSGRAGRFGRQGTCVCLGHIGDAMSIQYFAMQLGITIANFDECYLSSTTNTATILDKMNEASDEHNLTDVRQFVSKQAENHNMERIISNDLSQLPNMRNLFELGGEGDGAVEDNRVIALDSLTLPQPPQVEVVSNVCTSKPLLLLHALALPCELKLDPMDDNSTTKGCEVVKYVSPRRYSEFVTDGNREMLSEIVPSPDDLKDMLRASYERQRNKKQFHQFRDRLGILNDLRHNHREIWQQ